MIGVLILSMTVLCSVGWSMYSRMLGGKPLPALTQLVLDIHWKPGGYIFAIVVVIVATHAFAVHLAVSHARDVVSGTWVWLFLMTVTALAMTIYGVLGFLSLLLPLISFPGGMAQVTPESEAAEFRAFLISVALSFGSVFYAVFLSVLMWRRKLVWAADAGFEKREK